MRAKVQLFFIIQIVMMDFLFKFLIQTIIGIVIFVQ